MLASIIPHFMTLLWISSKILTQMTRTRRNMWRMSMYMNYCGGGIGMINSGWGSFDVLTDDTVPI
jgi:hypothetical protein